MEFGRAERRRCAPVFIPQFLLSAVSVGNAFSPPATALDGVRQRGAFFDNMCGGGEKESLLNVSFSRTIQPDHEFEVSP